MANLEVDVLSETRAGSIHGRGGGQINIRGGQTGDGMLLEGQIHYVSNGATADFRGLWTPLPDGRVRQFFEQSNDGGKTWEAWFAGFYSTSTNNRARIFLNRKIRYGGVPAGNPLVNALMVIVGVLAVGATIVLGIVAFLVVASIIVVLAGIVGIRVWWHRRRMQGAFDVHKKNEPGGASETRVIEGEYHSVTTRNESERRPRDQD